MSNIIPLMDWLRPHHLSGGGDAFLYYVVFGTIEGDLVLSREKYRCNGVPEEIEIQSYRSDAHAEVLDDFRSGYLWDCLRESEPALHAAIAAQSQCVVVRGTLRDPPDLGYFRDTIGVLTCLLDVGGVGIYDPQSFAWWSRSSWRSRVFDPAAPLPHEHVVILMSDESDGSRWFHTRGLRKFGRPDLSIHDVPRCHCAAVEDLFNRFIELQAFGGIISEGQPIRMASLPPGMYCVHRGDEDDPEFNNRHVEVLWPDQAERGEDNAGCC